MPRLLACSVENHRLTCTLEIFLINRVRLNPTALLPKLGFRGVPACRQFDRICTQKRADERLERRENQVWETQPYGMQI